MTLPPITDQGCASGLAGTAKMITAEAPIGATIRIAGHPSPKTIAVAIAVNAMPAAAPIHAASRLPNVAATRIGLNREREHITFL
jgi:hypothetical protein